MNHTYDSLRALAIQAVTFPSVDAPDALLVLEDALREAGVLGELYEPGCLTPKEHQRKYIQEWVMKWGMKAAYGARRVCTYTLGIDRALGFPDQSDHRAWSTERIEARKRGEIWRQKRKEKRK
jgi:hypothetical protein